MEKGSARLGMMVAETLRRNRKITGDDQAQREEHGELYVMERLADGIRPVVEYVHVDGRRQLGFEERQEVL